MNRKQAEPYRIEKYSNDRFGMVSGLLVPVLFVRAQGGSIEERNCLIHPSGKSLIYPAALAVGLETF